MPSAQSITIEEDRFGFDHHSPSTAIGDIVHFPVMIFRIIPQVMNPNPESSGLLRPAQDTLFQRTGKEFR